MRRRVLVELDADGETRGFVADDEPVHIELDDGTFRAFLPGITVGSLPARVAPIFGGSADSAGPRLTLQRSAFDLWAIRHHVAAQLVTGRVYWWPEGEVLRPEHEIYRGELRDPNWTLGPEGSGSLEFTLSAPTRIADVPFPPAAIGDDGRFPTAPDAARTSAVPVIYGTVVGAPLFAVSSIAADPIRLIIAGHRIVSTEIQVMRDGAVVSPNEDVFHDVDARGGEYAYVLVAKAVYDAGDALYAGEVTGWAGPDGAAIDRLGDVLLHLWHTYSRETFYDLDRRRSWAARVPLNRFRIGMFLNERDPQGTILRTMASRLQGQYPVVFGQAGGRFGWDAISLLDGEVSPTVREIIYGQSSFERVGPTQTSVDEIVTDFEATYLTDGFAGGTVRSKRADRDNDGSCRGAESRWGRSTRRLMDLPDVPDDATATAVLTDQVRRYTRVRDRVAYLQCDPELFDLPLLEEVLVTDDEAGWDQEPFYIESLTPRSDGRCDVGLIAKRGAGGED